MNHYQYYYAYVSCGVWFYVDGRVMPDLDSSSICHIPVTRSTELEGVSWARE